VRSRHGLLGLWSATRRLPPSRAAPEATALSAATTAHPRGGHHIGLHEHVRSPMEWRVRRRRPGRRVLALHHRDRLHRLWPKACTSSLPSPTSPFAASPAVATASISTAAIATAVSTSTVAAATVASATVSTAAVATAVSTATIATATVATATVATAAIATAVSTSTVSTATVAVATAISTATVTTATVATPIAAISSAVATLLTIATTAAAGYECVQLRDERVPGVDDGQHLEPMDTPIWTHAHPKHRTKRRC
jgi:hypothetical protein